MTARIAHIWRHPIKSHGRQEIDQVTLIQGQTMPWDRTWAVRHEASKADNSQWSPCANFSRGSKAPNLMALEAELDEATERLTLHHPALGSFSFDPNSEADRFIDWSAPLIPDERAQSASLVRVPNRGMTDTDFPSISLMNLASHRAVCQAVGQDLSPKRWRGNFWLDGLGPWEEFEWLGKSIRLGDAVLEVRERIVRCMATTANTQTGKRDADTLGALNNTWGHQDFGVYAVVTKGGDVRVGDAAELL